MFEHISFYIHGSHIEVGGKEFLLGELTCDILNITPEEYGEMSALAKRIDECGDEEAVLRLHGMLMQRRLFKLIAYPFESYSGIEKYPQIVSDIYSFNQTVFWFIDHFIMTLKRLDSENYAAALFDFYQHPGIDKMMVNHLRDGLHAFTLFDSINVEYLPREIPGQADTYAIYEVYSAEYLQAFLKMDFMKALIAGHTFRRCKNCKRFFLLTKKYKTAYCDRPLIDNPKLTCRQQGAKNQAKEKAKNNPVIQGYLRAYKRITADKSRGNITREQWVQAKAMLADLRDMGISGRLSDDEVEMRMQSNALYTSLGIHRSGKK